MIYASHVAIRCNNDTRLHHRGEVLEQTLANQRPLMAHSLQNIEMYGWPSVEERIILHRVAPRKHNPGKSNAVLNE